MFENRWIAGLMPDYWKNVKQDPAFNFVNNVSFFLVFSNQNITHSYNGLSWSKSPVIQLTYEV